MKSRLLSVCLCSVMTLQLMLPLDTGAVARSQQACENRKMTKPDAAYEQRKKDFGPAREMLRQAGVPFDPDLLLDLNWRKLLAPSFSRMPEMKRVIHGTPRLKGVVIADTLILPERVGLFGDTVILAKHLVFEGENAIIKGPHRIYIYPVETFGLLGRAQARNDADRAARFVLARYSVSTELSDKPETIKGGSITVDTSGVGRPELELLRATTSPLDPILQACSDSNKDGALSTGQKMTLNCVRS